MGIAAETRTRGFSLVEMLVAIALGLTVLAAGVQLYTQGVNATWTVSQRAEMQQDFRAASDMLTRDLSLAGAGLGNNVQIGLPAGTGTLPLYGCDKTDCYLNGKAATYPTQSDVPYLYGLLPGYRLGPQLNPSQPATDIVTVVYTDASFYLSCYSAKVTSSNSVRFTVPTVLPATCVLPPDMTWPQTVNDPVVGLTAGDLLWFSLNNGVAIAEVTAAGTLSGAAPNQYYDVTFAAGDPLNMNQTAATSGALVNYVNGIGSANRILVITYYIDNATTPPRLMRQVSGHSPVPVAEGVVYLQFSYDLYDSDSGKLVTDRADGGAGLSPPLTPNQITRINIKHMAMESSLRGPKGYQGLDLQTSVSARNLTFVNSYPQ